MNLHFHFYLNHFAYLNNTVLRFKNHNRFIFSSPYKINKIHITNRNSDKKLLYNYNNKGARNYFFFHILFDKAKIRNIRKSNQNSN